MDAHYHQVMKMREDIGSTEKRLYFAYSGVLDRQAFEKWREQHSYQFFNLPEGSVAEAKNMDLIFDSPSRWWGGRVAGLQEKKGSSVFGILYEIPANDWPVVQHKEGVISGLSVEKAVEVSVDGKTFQAIAFTTNPTRATTQGDVSQRYLQSLKAGAETSGLPAAYVDSLSVRAGV